MVDPHERGFRISPNLTIQQSLDGLFIALTDGFAETTVGAELTRDEAKRLADWLALWLRHGRGFATPAPYVYAALREADRRR